MNAGHLKFYIKYIQIWNKAFHLVNVLKGQLPKAQHRIGTITRDH